MTSRKRSWSGPAESTTNQKKKCSNPSYEPPTILTRHVAPRIPSTSHLLPKIRQTNVPQVCIHKRSNECMLSLNVCCACADKRPHSATYPVYVDGFGNVRAESRSIHYCAGCKGMIQTSLSTATMPDTLGQIGRASGTGADPARHQALLR